jgi:hypothetical protein
MGLTKEQSRKRWEELRDLLVAWDPLNLSKIGAPRDEYDCLLGPLMRHLEQGSTDNVVSSFLAHEFTDHFGVPSYAEEPDVVRFAQLARAWFSEHWSGSAV